MILYQLIILIISEHQAFRIAGHWVISSKVHSVVYALINLSKLSSPTRTHISVSYPWLSVYHQTEQSYYFSHHDVVWWIEECQCAYDIGVIGPVPVEQHVLKSVQQFNPLFIYLFIYVFYVFTFLLMYLLIH